MKKNRIRVNLVSLVALSIAFTWGNTYAVEGGKSLYLLGKRGPLAGLIPKPGWYVTNDMYSYNGDTDQEIPIAGLLNKGVSADALVNILQATWISETRLGNGRLAVAGIVPYGHVKVEAEATATTPGGTTLGSGVSDSITDFGDPALGVSLGWRKRDGDIFNAWSIYSSIFIPLGSYEKGRIANVGSNRWGLDVGTAFTRGDFKKSREFSGVFGITFNGENDDTGYDSGNEAHLELAYKQHLPSGLSVGIVGYYSKQITADSGGPKVLGDFKSQVGGIGPEIGYQFKAAGRSMSLDLRWYHEFDALNRVEGDAVFLTFSVPLQADPST